MVVVLGTGVLGRLCEGRKLGLNVDKGEVNVAEQALRHNSK